MQKLLRNRAFWAGALLFVALGMTWLVWKSQQSHRPDPILHQVLFQDSLYGIPLKDFVLEEGKIGPGDLLGNIFDAHGIGAQATFERISDVLDPRRIRPGQHYTFFYHTQDTSGPHYFVLEENKVDYIVVDLRGHPRAYKASKPLDIKLRKVSGRISNSLYMTLLEQGARPELALKMSDIFAWTLDFYRIEEGDWFQVMYEEKFLDKESIGIGNILGVRMNHRGKDFYAFLYPKEGEKADYYDENGESMRRAFLRNPIEYSRISSRFTSRRFHPVLKRFKAHLGTDYAAPLGTPIRTIGDGVVVEAAYSRYNGRYVKVKHNSVYTTQYLHMSRFGPGIRKGTRLKQGQVVGYVGSTGLATGPHLCFRFWKNGQQVDHLRQAMPPAKPIDPLIRQEYMQYKDSLMPVLTAIPLRTGQELALHHSLSIPVYYGFDQ